MSIEKPVCDGVPLADPKNRAELNEWLTRREEILGKGVPLTPREYLMVQRLGSGRPPYSIT